MAENVTPDHPAYYAEVLKRTTKVANQSSSNERSCPDLPGIVDVDDSLTRRLRTLLDAVASISLCTRENASATMACLNQDDGGINTRLYIAFNKSDEAALRCTQHLQGVFTTLSQVPYDPPTTGSPKRIAAKFHDRLDEISRTIHNYSFDIFAYRVNKRKHKLSDIRRHIEQDREHFGDDHRSMLVVFFKQVGMIIEAVAKADTKQLSTANVQVFRKIYTYWKQHNIIPDDALTDNKLTLLDNPDVWLAEKHHIGFQLRRWAMKIMSFMIAANRLFVLTQSRRLHDLLKGKFSVEILPLQATTPYRFNLSPEAKREALDAALAGTTYCTAEWNDVRQSFITELREEGGRSELVRGKPTIHAELAMIMATADGRVKNALPYIGVSKLSCIMCSHYIDTFNQVTNDQITTRGSHGKAYPGWFWPKLPSQDKKLRVAFLKAIRQELVSDFERYAERLGRLRSKSDSSVGSDFPDLEDEPSETEIEVLHSKALHTAGKQ